MPATHTDTKKNEGLRVAQICDADGQGWIAVISGRNVVARCTSWDSARRELKRLRAVAACDAA